MSTLLLQEPDAIVPVCLPAAPLPHLQPVLPTLPVLVGAPWITSLPPEQTAGRRRCFQASAGPLAPPLTELTDANPAADRLGRTRDPAGEQRAAREEEPLSRGRRDFTPGAHSVGSVPGWCRRRGGGLHYDLRNLRRRVDLGLYNSMNTPLPLCV